MGMVMHDQRDGWDDDGRGLVAFLPGIWMHPGSWTRWQLLFDRNGYDSVIVNVRGGSDRHPATSGPGPDPAGERLELLIATGQQVLSALTQPPVLIGHGLGALLVQVLLGQRGLARAAIALSPAPAGWVARTALMATARAALTVGSRSNRSTRSQISPAAFARYYANGRPVSEAADLYRRYVVPGSCRPMLQAASTLHPPIRTANIVDRPPLLVISGGKDRLTPESTAWSWERYGRRSHPDSVTDLHVFPDRGHSLIIDAGADEVANFCLDWLSSQNL